MECNETLLRELPISNDYYKELSSQFLIILSICGALTIVTLGLYIEELVFFFQNLHNWKPKDKALWLLGLYPVQTFTAFMALLVPRSSVLDDLVASLYLSICVYHFVTMLIGHLGGAKKMVRKLATFPIILNTAPLCCCCVCLPRLKVTRKRLQTLELMVLQYAILKPILSFVSTVLWMDEKFVNEDLSKTAAWTWINLINIISTGIALYGFAMVYTVSRDSLVKMTIKPKFICLQLVLILSNFQHVIIGVIVLFGGIKCDPPLSAKANGDRWHHVILILEMFVIALFARTYYRHHVGDLPPEDLDSIVPDMSSTATEVTNTLHRRNHTRDYGTTAQGPISSISIIDYDTVVGHSYDEPYASSLDSDSGQGLKQLTKRTASIATSTDGLVSNNINLEESAGQDVKGDLLLQVNTNGQVQGDTDISFIQIEVTEDATEA